MTLKEIENIDFEKGNGIVPVIVQDSNSKDVLTLAYSNKEFYLFPVQKTPLVAVVVSSF